MLPAIPSGRTVGERPGRSHAPEPASLLLVQAKSLAAAFCLCHLSCDVWVFDWLYICLEGLSSAESTRRPMLKPGAFASISSSATLLSALKRRISRLRSVQFICIILARFEHPVECHSEVVCGVHYRWLAPGASRAMLRWWRVMAARKEAALAFAAENGRKALLIIRRSMDFPSDSQNRVNANVCISFKLTCPAA